MLALVRKDLYVMKGAIIVYAAMWAILAAMLAWIPDSQHSVLAYTMPLLSANTVLYSLDADKKCHWDAFIAMTPLQPKDVVLAKYLLSYGNAALLTVIGFTASWISTLGKGAGFWTLYPILFVMLWGITILPLYYRFTKGQATVLMLLIWGFIIAVLLTPGGWKIAYFLFSWTRQIPEPLLMVIILATEGILSLFSIKLSIRWYTRRQRGWYDEKETLI